MYRWQLGFEALRAVRPGLLLAVPLLVACGSTPDEKSAAEPEDTAASLPHEAELAPSSAASAGAGAPSAPPPEAPPLQTTTLADDEGRGGATATSVDSTEAGGAGGSEPEPAAIVEDDGSCEGLSDGSYCGNELDTLYHCLAGVVAAKTTCPGTCENDACDSGTGAQSGSGHGKGK
ncbi:MAG TPA: hypothetical protein VM686_38385 [Polyangiaceae bacterium]|nr:hypothetical protein [Polyangiaceae bacterium]